jgi:ABC-type polysaccharide/polyol phosphate transport system ATPase subunit
MQSRILFDRVWKKFHRGEFHDSLRDLIPALARRLVGRGAVDSELQKGDFWAVRDLSFEVLPGQALGIIGPNGSGKSTTLKMLTKIMQPSRGYAEARGRVGTLIEVSAGFHGDLTGRENVFLQGAIMGMRSADIHRKFDEIVEFSGISASIDTQVKRYSSGMNARLGFSIAAHLEPDVLIIDEVLAVGDLSFQDRAFGRIKDLAQSGIPVAIVSHQLDRVAELCTDAILLREGQVVSRGTPDEVIGAYVRQHDAGRAVQSTGLIDFEPLRLGTDAAVRSGDRFTVHVRGHVRDAYGDGIEPMLLRVRSMRTGNILYGTSSRALGVTPPAPGSFEATFELQANLQPGSFMIELAARDNLKEKDISTAPSVMLRVSEATMFRGVVQMNAQLAVRRP